MGVLYKMDFPNGKSYIGITVFDIRRRMREHRKLAELNKGFGVHRAWRKYGEPRVTVLAVLENDELYSTEMRAIAAYATKAPRGYNLTIGGEGAVGQIVSEETRQKLRAANLGKKHSEETKKKRSLAMTGKVCSEETRRKIGAANKINGLGRVPSQAAREKLRITSTDKTHTVSAEGREKMRQAKLGTKMSDAHREKLRAASLGRVMSDEQKEKLRAINMGKKLTEEHKEKLRQAKLGKKLTEKHVAAIRAAKQANKAARQQGDL